jgi:hypothetical protein
LLGRGSLSAGVLHRKDDVKFGTAKTNEDLNIFELLSGDVDCGISGRFEDCGFCPVNDPTFSGEEHFSFAMLNQNFHRLTSKKAASTRRRLLLRLGFKAKGQKQRRFTI